MLKDLLDQYYQNLVDYYALENKVLVEGDIVDQIIEISKAKKIIQEKNDTLLAELSEILANSNNLPEADIKTLDFHVSKKDNPYQSIDAAVAMKIRLALLDNAKMHNNKSQIVRNLYFTGLLFDVMFYGKALNNNFERLSNPYFNEASGYLTEFENIAMGPRQGLMRCCQESIRRSDSSPSAKLKEYKKLINILSPYVESDKEYGYAYEISIQSINAAISDLVFDFESQVELDANDAADVYEATKNIRKALQENQAAYGDNFADNFIAYELIASYHNKMISLDELIKELDCYSRPVENDTELHNALRVFAIGSTYLRYVFISNISQDEKKRILDEKIKIAYQYGNNLKIEQNYFIDEYIIQFLYTVKDLCDYDEAKKIIFNTFIYRHKQTYVHTISVSRIVEEIAKTILTTNPHYFDNCFEQRITDTKVILTRLKEMALMHDTGKYGCMLFAQNCSRKLTDDEFNMIRIHPRFGINLFPKATPKYVKDAVLYHHCWHNGMGGYPTALEPTNNQPIIDIISIADSIDAATDYICRPYNSEKSLATLIAEFKDLAGTRYSQKVVDVLVDKDLLAKIEDIIGPKRAELIAEVYDPHRNIKL